MIGFSHLCLWPLYQIEMEKRMCQEKKLDVTKPMEFRNYPGWKVIKHLHTFDEKFGRNFPAIFLCVNPEGIEDIISRKADGSDVGKEPHGRDIINSPERVEKFVNVYKGGCGRFCDSLEEACRAPITPDGSEGIIKLIYEDGKLISACLLKE